LVLNATIDQRSDKLNRRRLDRHIAPIGFPPHILMEGVGVRGPHIANKQAIGLELDHASDPFVSITRCLKASRI